VHPESHSADGDLSVALSVYPWVRRVAQVPPFGTWVLGLGGWPELIRTTHLDQRDFPVEVELLLCAQFQRDAASCSDAFEHSKQVPRIFRILQTGNPSQNAALIADLRSHAKLAVMELTLHIPDEIAKRLSTAGADLSRRALEAIALEGYREQTLTLYQVSELLALSRVETEDFLGRHHVPLAAISEADLDREAALFEAASRRPR